MWFVLLLFHTEHAEKTGVPAKLWGLQISLYNARKKQTMYHMFQGIEKK
jgi:hypothetical protein